MSGYVPLGQGHPLDRKTDRWSKQVFREQTSSCKLLVTTEHVDLAWGDAVVHVLARRSSSGHTSENNPASEGQVEITRPR